jgi:hypothetical protein
MDDIGAIGMRSAEGLMCTSFVESKCDERHGYLYGGLEQLVYFVDFGELMHARCQSVYEQHKETNGRVNQQQYMFPIHLITKDTNTPSFLPSRNKDSHITQSPMTPQPHPLVPPTQIAKACTQPYNHLTLLSPFHMPLLPVSLLTKHTFPSAVGHNFDAPMVVRNMYLNHTFATLSVNIKMSHVVPVPNIALNI